MPKNSYISDAWDDDWEAQADRAEKEELQPAPEPEPSMTKAERIAKHKEEQRRIWESAEVPKDVNFLVAASTPPLATPFKPAVKLLSRKPAPKSIVRKDPVTGLEQRVLVDDDEEENDSKKYQPTPEEIRQRQQRELEEKQRRYNEARAKIFGESSPSSGQSTPGTVTPPGDGRHGYRGRGRGGRGGGDHRNNARQDEQSRRAPTTQHSGTRELFDPNYTSKPGSNTQRRGGDASPQSGSRSSTPRVDDQVIRSPRGPDGSGRGGFGFARRGARGG